MKEEIAAAVVFLSRLVRQCGSIPNEKMASFSDSLSAILVEKFKNHWYQESPTKGQAYRCIRINPEEPVDPVLEMAVIKSGIAYKDLKLFCELTLWVDPSDVCCRFGEPYGPICTLASSKDGHLENKAHTVEIDEYLEKEKERYNNQINIVTTRSSASSRPYSNNHNLVYNGYNSYHQHNYHNNYRHQRNNNNRRKINAEPQVNGIRDSPEHVNEVRQQFINQVNSIAGKSEKVEDRRHTSSPSSEESSSSSEGNKSPDQTPEKSKDKKASQSNKSHQQKGKHTSNANQGKSKQGSSNHGFKHFQGKGGEQFYWGKGSGPTHNKFSQAQKVH